MQNKKFNKNRTKIKQNNQHQIFKMKQMNLQEIRFIKAKIQKFLSLPKAQILRKNPSPDSINSFSPDKMKRQTQKNNWFQQKQADMMKLVLNQNKKRDSVLLSYLNSSKIHLKKRNLNQSPSQKQQQNIKQPQKQNIKQPQQVKLIQNIKIKQQKRTNKTNTIISSKQKYVVSTFKKIKTSNQQPNINKNEMIHFKIQRDNEIIKPSNFKNKYFDDKKTIQTKLNKTFNKFETQSKQNFYSRTQQLQNQILIKDQQADQQQNQNNSQQLKLKSKYKLLDLRLQNILNSVKKPQQNEQNSLIDKQQILKKQVNNQIICYKRLSPISRLVSETKRSKVKQIKNDLKIK